MSKVKTKETNIFFMILENLTVHIRCNFYYSKNGKSFKRGYIPFCSPSKTLSIHIG